MYPQLCLSIRLMWKMETQTIQLTVDIDVSMKRAIKQALMQLKGGDVKETKSKTSMTKKEYFAMLDHSIEQAKNGNTVAMNEGETLQQFMLRLPYA